MFDLGERENKLRDKIYKKYGEQEYEIISFGKSTDPLELLCLKCKNKIYVKYQSNFFVKGRKNFCCFCSKTKKTTEIKDGGILPIEKAQKRLDDFWGGREYTIVPEKYEGWSKKGIVKHEKCGKYFKIVIRELVYHSHCPCYTIISKGENKIEEVLQKLEIQYIKQYRFGDMLKAPYDFFLPEYNLLIEFQGRQHYEPVSDFGGEEQFKIQQDIDQRKYNNAIKYGHQIFYISYKDKSNIEKILIQRLSQERERVGTSVLKQ